MVDLQEKHPLITSLLQLLKTQKKPNVKDLKTSADFPSSEKPHKKHLFKLLVFLGIVFLLGIFFHLEKSIFTLKKNQTKTKTILRKFGRSASAKPKRSLPASLTPWGSLPASLYNIPYAETDGIVLNVKTVQIRNVFAPSNASLLENGDNFILFFRYDKPNRHAYPHHFFTNIGVVELDKNFEQTDKEFSRLDTQSNYSEDPRAVKVGNEVYVFYNEVHPHTNFCRTMKVANVDLKNFQLNFFTNLDLQMQPVEKNWMPFEYINDKGKPLLCFAYYLNPHKIFELPDPHINDCKSLLSVDYHPYNHLPWPSIWGPPRGGTGPRLIGNEYLGFFHSSFSDNDDIIWYVIGAYTFEATPPFAITSISNYPILFKGIYNTPPLNTATPKIRCVFPCGFAIEQQNGKELIHVACGENNSSVKIITMDKEALLKSLKKIDNGVPK